MADDERPFLARWSQRKSQARSVAPPVVSAPMPTPVPVVVAPPAPAETEPLPPAPQPLPLPTLDDVAALTHASDYSRFVAPGVEPGVSNAAMKKLFSDPHFNVMDGLDIYIGDYSQPDPIAPEMLRKMVQSKFLGLFDDEDDEAQKAAAGAPQTAPPTAESGLSATAPVAADNLPHDDHTDLQLQPDHAAGRRGTVEGTGPDQV